jgi:hypothetical protein
MRICRLSLCLSVSLAFALPCCSVSADTNSKTQNSVAKDRSDASKSSASVTDDKSGKKVIDVAPNSPAEAVILFYRNLREKRFREALMMTNLRPAIEGLSDAETEELRTDFEVLAEQIPEKIEINGEVISGDNAAVTARMPNDDTGALELKEFKLRREGQGWTILTADEETETAARKEGKNYFFNLRIEVHHSEVRKVFQNISNAEMVYSVKNNGALADLKTLVDQQLLPPATLLPETLGYRFNVTVSSNGKSYVATAEPVQYGKTGRLSFILEPDKKNGQNRLRSEDRKGQPIKR